MNEAILVTVGLFMAGVVFQLGRFAARLEGLEAWRADVKGQFDKVFEMLREIRDDIHSQHGR